MIQRRGPAAGAFSQQLTRCQQTGNAEAQGGRCKQRQFKAGQASNEAQTLSRCSLRRASTCLWMRRSSSAQYNRASVQAQPGDRGRRRLADRPRTSRQARMRARRRRDSSLTRAMSHNLTQRVEARMNSSEATSKHGRRWATECGASSKRVRSLSARSLSNASRASRFSACCAEHRHRIHV